jgi:hypothetical protein
MIKKIDWKMIEKQANPDCKRCKGHGWLPDSKSDLKYGRATAQIGDKKFPVKDLNFSKRRVCPVCFDPFGNPRDGQRVKK